MAIGFSWLTPFVRKLLGTGAVTAISAALLYWWFKRRWTVQRQLEAPPPTAGTVSAANATPFERAVAFVSSGRVPNIGTSDQLRFYALFKQAGGGDNDRPRPSALDMTARAKWDAWDAVRGMATPAARAAYIDALTALVPDWDSESARAAPSPAKAASAGASSSGGMGMGPRPLRELAAVEAPEEVTDANAQTYAADPSLFSRVIVDGNLEAIRRLLASGQGLALEARDAEGCTALHFAVDRGHAEVAQALLEAGADVNAVDGDGSTPLHYAAATDDDGDHVAVARVLLRFGANRNARDSDELTPLQTAESTEMRALLSAA